MAAPTTRLASFVIEHHKRLDYTPLVSTVVNLAYLFEKTIGSPYATNIGILHPSERFWTHLQNKSFSRCLVLLVPVLGNIVIAIADFMANKTKQELIAAIRKDPDKFINAPRYLKKDEDVRNTAADAFLAEPEKLKDAWKKLKWESGVKWQFHCRVDIARAALKSGAPVSLPEVDDSLCDDEDFVLGVLAREQDPNDCSSELEIVTPRLQACKKVVLAAVQKSQYALQWASQVLRADEDVVFAAVKKNEWALGDADKTLSTNKDFIIRLIKELKKLPYSVDESIKSDPDVIFELFCINRRTSIPQSLEKDEGFILRIMRISEEYICKAHPSLLENGDFMLKAMAIQGGWTAFYLHKSLKENADFMLKAMRIKKSISSSDCQDVVRAADFSLKENRGFMLSAIEIDANAFTYAASSLKDNADFLCEALRRNPELAKDEWFMRQAISKRAATLADAHPSIQNGLKQVAST